MTNSGDDRHSREQDASPAPSSGREFARRRAVAFFVAAAIAAVLALTSGRWLPALPTLFGAIEANSELIGALADLTQIVTFVMLVIGAVLAYLGFRNLRSATAGEGVPQAVNVGEGGRGAAVGGDINRGAVVMGDHNRVEVVGDITYNYRDVAPSPVDAGTRESAGRQLEALPLEEVPDRSELPSGSVMPYRPNRYFVGREEQFKIIASNLKAGGATSLSEVTVAASSGLGGVGKTQLASEFVHRYGRYFYGVYWLSFAESGSVPAQIAFCGGAGGMNLRPDFHTLPFEEQVRAVMAEWQGELPRLLVFDNCEHENLLDRWLPPTGGCRVLVTSRRGYWDPSLGVLDLPLDVFSRQESVALLRRHRPDLPADSSELDAIAAELGDLPLALDLAGRYLKRYRREVTPAAYLLEIWRPELLEHPSLRRARGVSPTKHDMDVWRTFALSYWRLDADDEPDRTAVRLLARAARLAPGEPIPDGLLAWTLEPSDGDGDPPLSTTTVRDAIVRLTDLGLLEESGGETFRIHRLVVAFTLAEVPDDGAQPAVEAACSRAARRVSRQGQPARREALLPHLRFVTDLAKGRVDHMAANCCTALSISLGEFGAHDEALPYAELAWQISVRLYGPEDRATLQRRSNIGFLLEGKEDRVESRTIYKEVLEAQESRLGREDPDVAATLNNLGASFVREDLYHETLSLYRRALHIREAVWERTRPDDSDRSENAYELAESYDNMGTLLMDLGRHGEAGSYLTRAAEILSEEAELVHERNAKTLILIGRALRAEKDYPTAAATLRSALAIYENISVRPPPVAASALSNLGAVLAEWAEQDGALSALRRAQLLEASSTWLRAALNGFEQMHGEWYPATGGCLGPWQESATHRGILRTVTTMEDGRRPTAARTSKPKTRTLPAC